MREGQLIAAAEETYARRYALFTLVGIAGEDDLDAPDLIGTDHTITTKVVEVLQFPELRSPVLT